MSMGNATWRNGQVILDTPAGWPEGHRLVVQSDASGGFEFATEDEQSDDPASIERWVAALAALPAIEEVPAEEAARRAWDETMRSFNLEAVRRQFETGAP